MPSPSGAGGQAASLGQSIQGSLTGLNTTAIGANADRASAFEKFMSAAPGYSG